MKTNSPPEALAGVVALEISDTPGACFAASLLADFNATVYVCETLPSGSSMRRREPAEWWQIIGRNKHSVAIDPDVPRSVEAIRALLARADLIVTDVPALQRQSHPWLRELSHIASKPLMVDVFPSGADRPDLWRWSAHSELASAVTGQMALTGQADREPVRPEFPLAEYLSGVLAALRAVTELRRLRGTGAARDVEVPLHMAMQRMIEWQVPIASGMGKAELRNGNAFPMNFSIGNMHRTRDGKYIAVSAANEATAGKLLEMLGGRALREDPRFATLEARMAGLDEIYAILDRWMGERSVAEVMQAAELHDVVLGQIHDTEDVMNDAHMRARANIVQVETGGGASIAMPGVVPRVVGWSTSVKTLGPRLGAHTEYALRACSMPADVISQLRDAGAIQGG